MAVAVSLPGSTGLVRAGAGPYLGFRVRETSGSAVAAFRLWDNTTAASGTLVDTVSLAAGESARETDEVIISRGIYFELVSGAVEGSVILG